MLILKTKSVVPIFLLLENIQHATIKLSAKFKKTFVGRDSVPPFFFFQVNFRTNIHGNCKLFSGFHSYLPVSIVFLIQSINGYVLV